MKVGIGNDHAAVELKMQIKEFIESMGHDRESFAAPNGGCGR